LRLSLYKILRLGEEDSGKSEDSGKAEDWQGIEDYGVMERIHGLGASNSCDKSNNYDQAV
jgi:hypothetical protein